MGTEMRSYQLQLYKCIHKFRGESQGSRHLSPVWLAMHEPELTMKYLMNLLLQCTKYLHKH